MAVRFQVNLRYWPERRLLLVAAPAWNALLSGDFLRTIRPVARLPRNSLASGDHRHRDPILKNNHLPGFATGFCYQITQKTESCKSTPYQPTSQLRS
jgi:hypothetical protein